MKSLHQAFTILLCLCAGFVVDCAAQYPARAIRIIVPVPPGASLDTLARTVGARLSTRVGQTVLIENQPGGAGNIAYGNVAKAAPDGYTLLLGWDGLQILIPACTKICRTNSAVLRQSPWRSPRRRFWW